MVGDRAEVGRKGAITRSQRRWQTIGLSQHLRFFDYAQIPVSNVTARADEQRVFIDEFQRIEILRIKFLL